MYKIRVYSVYVFSIFFFQVQFVDDRKLTNVNKRDFFLHVFDELMSPQSDMFMYNEIKTLAWFPPKVSKYRAFLVDYS